ncbi:alpha/beta fold hydrolase [Flavobacterium johnsoniae]|uniref:Peptidase family S33 n=1 Tax=Flavobacterium johnsoniae (strain ATCC 17061 / DSM 2064 / JCM 8514 / BCRC 14874 / CCUG 350202 / NBRC 14942 / NCIMB 11054 / UW101) TaxID=376686 RepID=A5FHX2_FLAJ1|nr:alpha/beta hydrolase [Flavobacterium johnsoniae]ABQ05199.1 peptidase family S33 [Flavobacterium johnsoniae UW101]OXE96912.1 alpha/beta hydrolase [Flavobacterium johnsoniae UW101]WQG82998.1 alpha/beta hydrolase [Flavobacterium johnsoniae UW101]SHL64075.1 Pimeloyl-ACP methyl ester carboxylesterase [Flavobacterium johnsoniae]
MLKLYSRLFIVLFLVTSCASKKAKFEDYVFKTKSEEQKYQTAYNKSLKLWEIPYTEEDVKTSFGTAHVIIAGPKNGKDLVLLHGMDASSTMWYPNIKVLAKNHRIYAIDFIMEPNKSHLTAKPLSSEDILVYYNEIFSYYKLKKFDIIGASRGGWIATLLATQKPNSIDKIVLLSPAQTFKFIDKVGKTTSALMLKLFPSEKKFGKTLSTFSTHPEKISPVYKRQFYLANKYAKSNSSMLKMHPFSDKELLLIQNPVLVIIGDKDVINSEESLERAQKYLANSKTKIIKDAGHFLTIDQPKITNDAVINFLE